MKENDLDGDGHNDENEDGKYVEKDEDDADEVAVDEEDVVHAAEYGVRFHWKQQEDIEMAERYFRQAVMCDPEDFDMKLEYGMYLMDAKFDYMAAQVKMSFTKDKMIVITKALFLSVLEKYPKTGYALIG